MIRPEDTYNVISESSLVALIGLTNLAMVDGWRPVGGIHTMKNKGYMWYFQAMTKVFE